ncbi:hypothetical protein C1645_815609 [Glomus cerebriforme]|uniref:Protein kinase domain-containing protein n=1 Tax=Glomus cerebriforme TaxID=658196 RepID=A0A397TMN4_9GLOM|nr:hypothetical protein C1645_815609 [Glomus cerebriforme]
MVMEYIENDNLRQKLNRDFNSLSWNSIRNEITNLGLFKPANEKSEECNKKVYGVLPYVAPEDLKGKKYTQESDVYSFGIIIYLI